MSTLRTTLAGLVAKWRKMADEFAVTLGDSQVECAYGGCADELEAALRAPVYEEGLYFDPDDVREAALRVPEVCECGTCTPCRTRAAAGSDGSGPAVLGKALGSIHNRFNDREPHTGAWDEQRIVVAQVIQSFLAQPVPAPTVAPPVITGPAESDSSWQAGPAVALAKQFKAIARALNKEDYSTAWDLAHSGAHMAENQPGEAVALRTLAQQALGRMMQTVEGADFPDPEALTNAENILVDVFGQQPTHAEGRAETYRAAAEKWQEKWREACRERDELRDTASRAQAALRERLNEAETLYWAWKDSHAEFGVKVTQRIDKLKAALAAATPGTQEPR